MSASSTGEDIPFTEVADGVKVRVWVQPGAQRSEVTGVKEGMLRVRLRAPAREGQANEELLRLIAESLGVAKGRVQLEAGAKARRKVIRVSGVSVDGVRRLLAIETKGGRTDG